MLARLNFNWYDPGDSHPASTFMSLTGSEAELEDEMRGLIKSWKNTTLWIPHGWFLLIDLSE